MLLEIKVTESIRRLEQHCIRYFIKPGLIDRQVGRLYDELFNARQQGDYAPLVEFDKQVVIEQAVDVGQLLPQLRGLVTQLLDRYEEPNGV